MSTDAAGTDGWLLSDQPYEVFEQSLRADPEAFVDPAGFRAAMVRAERCVARIESPELEPLGTGFLVAPDLVVTNNHVRSDVTNRGKRAFDADPAAVRVRFGHVSGPRVGSRTYDLHADWLVESSPERELDFCLFRLAEPAGDHRIGDGPRAPARGWVTASAADVASRQSLFILQHPFGEPLKFAAGHLVTAAGGWVDYGVNTEPGSSGSPVFDCRWQCVALHSRAGKGTNRGASFRAILDALPAGIRDRPGRAVQTVLEQAELLTKDWVS